MTKQIVAGERVNREAEGRKLYRERGEEIRCVGSERYEVPSRSMNGQRHSVDLGLEVCSCKDYQYRGSTCAHMIAAKIAATKPRKALKRERHMFSPEQVMKNIERLEGRGA